MALHAKGCPYSVDWRTIKQAFCHLFSLCTVIIHYCIDALTSVIWSLLVAECNRDFPWILLYGRVTVQTLWELETSLGCNSRKSHNSLEFVLSNIMRILKSQYVIYEDQINAISLKGQVECKDIPQENTFLLQCCICMNGCYRTCAKVH